MSRPEDYPKWADKTETDQIYGTANKAVPSIQKQEYGQRGNQNTLRQDINYLFFKIYRWIKFFDKQLQVGTIHIVVDEGQTELQMSKRLGGKWEFFNVDGKATMAGVPVLVFEKVSEVNQ